MSQLLLGGGGALGGVIVVIALSKFLLGSALSTLHTEIVNLRERLESEQEDRRKNDEIVGVRMAQLEKLYDQQRKEKHDIRNEFVKVSMLLGIVVELAEKCTCGALNIVKDLMARVAASTFPEPDSDSRVSTTTTTTTTQGEKEKR